ncbi:reverse transcriptase [Plakobranchus ocellatus]|uniref:Reverse transcriptase n=1 Tax=Plakobranchus ocellatus TaxID=259542 RepID=A0AAV4AU65_9GAST|nr:reverse transcriptase [Plakobranchus ocellatus]
MEIHRTKIKCLENSKDRQQRSAQSDKTSENQARQLFQQPRSGTLTAQKDELDPHLCKTYSDPEREKPLEDIEGLVWPSLPGDKFNKKPPTLDEVN